MDCYFVLVLFCFTYVYVYFVRIRTCILFYFVLLSTVYDAGLQVISSFAGQ